MGAKVWGYDILRIFGTAGMIESSIETGVARLIRKGKDAEILDTRTRAPDYFNMYVHSLLGHGSMLFSTGEELDPARWALRAGKAARPNG